MNCTRFVCNDCGGRQYDDGRMFFFHVEEVHGVARIDARFSVVFDSGRGDEPARRFDQGVLPRNERRRVNGSENEERGMKRVDQEPVLKVNCSILDEFLTSSTNNFGHGAGPSRRREDRHGSRHSDRSASPTRSATLARAPGSRKNELRALRRRYPNACPVCLRTDLERPQDLKRHLGGRHGTWLKRPTAASHSSTPDESSAAEFLWSHPPHCDACFMDFSHWSQVEEHWLADHSKSPLPTSPLRLSVSVCPVCRLRPRTFDHFIRDHTNTCPVCLVRHWNQAEADEHFRAEHAGWVDKISLSFNSWTTVWEKQGPKCPACGKVFKTWDAAQVHHEGRKCASPHLADDDDNVDNHHDRERRRPRSPNKHKHRKHKSSRKEKDGERRKKDKKRKRHDEESNGGDSGKRSRETDPEIIVLD